MFSIGVLLERHNTTSSSLSSSKLIHGNGCPVPGTRYLVLGTAALGEKSFLVARESLNSSGILGASIPGILGTRLSRVLNTDKHPDPRPWYFAKVVPKISIKDYVPTMA